MTDDSFERARAFAWIWDPVPIGIVAIWAVIGVVGIVLVVRLHQDHFGVKLGASLLALGGAALLLLCASLRDQPTTSYEYKRVDEVVAEWQKFRVKRLPLQVHGCVVPDSIERRIGTDDYRFRIQTCSTDRPKAVIRARYTGLVPEAFRSGVEIIAKGTVFGDDGLDVVSDGIMAKISQKYHPEPEWRLVEPGS